MWSKRVRRVNKEADNRDVDEEEAERGDVPRRVSTDAETGDVEVAKQSAATSVSPVQISSTFSMQLYTHFESALVANSGCEPCSNTRLLQDQPYATQLAETRSRLCVKFLTNYR